MLVLSRSQYWCFGLPINQVPSSFQLQPSQCELIFPYLCTCNSWLFSMPSKSIHGWTNGLVGGTLKSWRAFLNSSKVPIKQVRLWSGQPNLIPLAVRCFRWFLTSPVDSNIFIFVATQLISSTLLSGDRISYKAVFVLFFYTLSFWVKLCHYSALWKALDFYNRFRRIRFSRLIGNSIKWGLWQWKMGWRLIALLKCPCY